MRREGRIHGSYVRESKHSGWPPVKASSKPTSRSRCTGKCASGRVRCKSCAFALPLDKSLNKTKGNVKAKVFNINSNYKMQDWRVCDSSPPSSSSSKKPILKVERPFGAWDQYADLDYQQSDSECENESQQDDDVEDQDEEQPSSWTSEIVLPIESLLRARKIRETLPDCVSEGVDESTNDGTNDSTNDGPNDSTVDSDGSWSGIDMSDVDDDMSDSGESWANDWSLVEEELYM